MIPIERLERALGRPPQRLFYWSKKLKIRHSVVRHRALFSKHDALCLAVLSEMRRKVGREKWQEKTYLRMKANLKRRPNAEWLVLLIRRGDAKQPLSLFWMKSEEKMLKLLARHPGGFHVVSLADARRLIGDDKE